MTIHNPANLTDAPLLKLMIPALAAANFVIGMGAFMVVGLLLPIAESHGITAAQAGGLMTTYAVAYAVLTPLLGAITGQVDRRVILCCGLILFALGSAGTAMAPDYLWLCVGRMVAASGAALITPVAAVVAAQQAAPGRRARALAGVFYGMTVAQVLGVPAGSWLGHTFGWETAFWIVSAACIPVMVAVWSSVPAGLDFVSVNMRDLSRCMLDPRRMLAVGFTVLFLGGIYVVFTYIAPLLAGTMGYQRDGLILVLFFGGIGAVLGNFAGGQMADRIGSYRTLVILCAAQLLLLPTFSFLPVPPLALLALVLVWSALGWSSGAAQQARLLAMDKITGPVLISLNAGAAYVAAALGSALGGVALSQFGLTSLGWTGGFVIIAAAVALVASERWNRKHGENG